MVCSTKSVQINSSILVHFHIFVQAVGMGNSERNQDVLDGTLKGYFL